MKTNLLKKCATLVALFSICLTFVSGRSLAATENDNFDDNTRNASKWGRDHGFGHGVLTEKNHRFEYTCGQGTTLDVVQRPWILTRFPYNADWAIQMDTFNNTSPTDIFQKGSMGINLLSQMGDDTLCAEFYSSAFGGLPAQFGFHTDVTTDSAPVTSVDTDDLGINHGAVRMEFNSTLKVITVLCDTNIGDGYQWVSYGSIGVAGALGADGNTDWGMTETNLFSAYVYGFSRGMTITEGQMFVDNFVETGGLPTHGYFPVPTGSFQFGFPTNNPLLTQMVSVSGNYSGVTPTKNNRNYDIDVAEDESGKIAVMGVMDGILDKNGSPDIAGSLGMVKTVNAQPKLQLKSTFAGTRDGMAVTASGNATGPVDVIDVGGTNGLGGTGTYKSKIAGVPFGGKNLPVAVAAPPGSEANLKKDWSVQLDINKRDIKGKERTLSSAQLFLPNGETVVFGEKIVKFSKTKGYSLAFVRGTNTTINPPKLDKKSSIVIKGLTFIQQGEDWQPTGGIITYKFLGQNGTANLLDFKVP